MNQVKTLRFFDYLGMGLSLLCLFHCLAIPVILGALPVLAEDLFEHERFHLILIAFVLPVAGLSLLPGYFRTRRQAALKFGFVGLLLLGTGALLGHDLGHAGETAFSVIGAACLFRAHWINQARACACPSQH